MMDFAMFKKEWCKIVILNYFVIILDLAVFAAYVESPAKLVVAVKVPFLVILTGTVATFFLFGSLVGFAVDLEGNQFSLNAFPELLGRQ